MPVEHLENTEMGKGEKPRVTPLHGDDRGFSLSVSFLKKSRASTLLKLPIWDFSAAGDLSCWSGTLRHHFYVNVCLED